MARPETPPCPYLGHLQPSLAPREMPAAAPAKLAAQAHRPRLWRPDYPRFPAVSGWQHSDQTTTIGLTGKPHQAVSQIWRPQPLTRSEQSRVGKEGVSRWGSRW